MDVIRGNALFPFGCDTDDFALVCINVYQSVWLPLLDVVKVGLELSWIILCRDGSVQQAVVRKQSGFWVDSGW